jgi:uncharacterized protein (DUF427 family)
MPKAMWNQVVLAASEQTEVVDGNHYFPLESLNREHFRTSEAHTVCGWKGTASYYDIVVGEQVNEQAAWYYPDPKPEAANIKGHIAFWKGVEVVA